MKTDNNRGITDILYNYLGLPERIEFGATKHIENVYDAEGLKLSQKFVNGSTTIQTDYMGDLIYRNDSLKTILHDEGRIAYKNDTLYTYQFFIQDHLGNTRIIIERVNATTALVQETHYGAWGEILEGIGQTGDWNFLFQGKEYVDGYGFDFHSRNFDSWSGRFDQIDGANQFASGFVGMGNNPVSNIDPDGQFVIAPILIGAAIFGGINLVGESIKGNVKDFKSGAKAFGIGAIQGALAVATGGSSITYGQVALQALVAQIPSLNVDLGSGFSLSLSPAIAFGTNQFSLGLNVGAAYNSENFGAGISLTGLYNGNSVGTGGKSLEGRFGYGVRVGSDNGLNFSLYSTKFSATNGSSQQVGGASLGYKGFSARYENDEFFKLNPLMADGGDRYRTNAVQLAYGDISINLNMFTGDAGLSRSDRETTKNAQGIPTYIEKTPQYRLGALAVGYKNTRLGINSEGVRNEFQNKFAHKNGRKYPIFQVLNNNVNFYFNHGTRIKFTLW